MRELLGLYGLPRDAATELALASGQLTFPYPIPPPPPPLDGTGPGHRHRHAVAGRAGAFHFYLIEILKKELCWSTARPSWSWIWSRWCQRSCGYGPWKNLRVAGDVTGRRASPWQPVGLSLGRWSAAPRCEKKCETHTRAGQCLTESKIFKKNFVEEIMLYEMNVKKCRNELKLAPISAVFAACWLPRHGRSYPKAASSSNEHHQMSPITFKSGGVLLETINTTWMPQANYFLIFIIFSFLPKESQERERKNGRH